MRYAITYTTDETWNSVDTFIVETTINPLDMTDEQLVEMFKGYITYDGIVAENVALDGELWFVRNLDDTDVKMEGGKNEK